MMLRDLKVVVNGKDNDGKMFSEILDFHLIPPRKGKNYYGNGYMMSIKTKRRVKHIDVRYQQTTDIEVLAERWINTVYGENAEILVKFVNLTEKRKGEKV